MKIIKQVAMGAVIAALGSTAAALAAPGPALPIIGGPNAITAGVFIPSSGAAKSAGGNTQFDVEFHYGLPIPNPTPLRVVLGVGVETGSKSGSHSTVVPLTAGLQVGVGGGVYAGAGIGYYFLNQHRNSDTLDQLGTTSKVGGYGELGYALPGGLVTVSAKYQAVKRADGFVLAVGLHF
ncbi:MAG: hypothetical protein ACRYFS_24665 [Janthinobacterium lividum]